MTYKTMDTLEELEARKKETLNKIIHGDHLDALSMDALQRKLADLTKKIEAKRKEEVSNG